jgi:hypothetical protein
MHTHIYIIYIHNIYTYVYVSVISYADDTFPSHYWTILESLIQILQPFQKATDICQKDNATLYTFHNAFNEMKKDMQMKVIAYTIKYMHAYIYHKANVFVLYYRYRLIMF